MVIEIYKEIEDNTLNADNVYDLHKATIATRNENLYQSA